MIACLCPIKRKVNHLYPAVSRYFTFIIDRKTVLFDTKLQKTKRPWSLRFVINHVVFKISTNGNRLEEACVGLLGNFRPIFTTSALLATRHQHQVYFFLPFINVKTILWIWSRHDSKKFLFTLYKGRPTFIFIKSGRYFFAKTTLRNGIDVEKSVFEICMGKSEEWKETAVGSTAKQIAIIP